MRQYPFINAVRTSSCALAAVLTTEGMGRSFWTHPKLRPGSRGIPS